MLPVIFGGTLVATAVATYVAYKKKRDKESRRNQGSECPRIGTFAIWGRPDVGKTTFINFLLGDDHQSLKKEATTHRTWHQNINVSANGRKYVINEITDMPGAMDRMDDWLDLARQSDHVFYMLDASKDNREYANQVLNDLKETVKVIGGAKADGKKKGIHIIATHIDLSKFKDCDVSSVHNEIQQDHFFRKIYESRDGACGYVYVANLTDPDSCRRLLESIVGDCYRG